MMEKELPALREQANSLRSAEAALHDELMEARHVAEDWPSREAELQQELKELLSAKHDLEQREASVQKEVASAAVEAAAQEKRIDSLTETIRAASVAAVHARETEVALSAELLALHARQKEWEQKLADTKRESEALKSAVAEASLAMQKELELVNQRKQTLACAHEESGKSLKEAESELEILQNQVTC
jgi:chromosome segregation ATPase